jgi:uncharacterized membrane protein YkvA (DUF1232 family)
MFNEQKATETLISGYEEAEKVLNDVDKLEELLQALEKKLKKIPAVGEKLSYVPVMVLLIRSYIKKEYTQVPLGSIIAAISSVLYVVNHFDLIPDSIPLAGYLDDAAVLTVALKMIESDIDDYKKWCIANGKKI